VETIMTRCVSTAVAAVGPALLTLAACAAARVGPPDKQLPLHLGHDQKLEFVWIKPGRFLMGSPASDKLAGEVEKPQREVRFEKGFYLARTTVTFGQFQEFVLDAGYRTDAETETRPRLRGGHGFNANRNTFEGWFPQYTWRNPGWPMTDDHPVGNVSWNDAVKFCAWLSKKSGKSVRLPTEAEWEYACRAGTTTVFFTGDDPASLKGYANVPDASLRARLKEPAGKETFPFDDGYSFTAPVGKFKPNPWGLYDMIGNVFQWCADEVPGDTPRRALRGGSYNLNIETCRCAYRGFSKPEGRYSYTGFRVVVVP
jgi:formylglycine-generating enzyme required for sulfatase activity